MQEIIRQPAPPKRVRTVRLTPELKALPIDPETGVRVDYETAKCLRSYARYHGWDIIQKSDGATVIIWRIG